MIISGYFRDTVSSTSQHTFYYWLRKVRESSLEEAPQFIVPLGILVAPLGNDSISIVKNDLQITLPESIETQTLLVVSKLC